MVSGPIHPALKAPDYSSSCVLPFLSRCCCARVRLLPPTTMGSWRQMMSWRELPTMVSGRWQGVDDVCLRAGSRSCLSDHLTQMAGGEKNWERLPAAVRGRWQGVDDVWQMGKVLEGRWQMLCGRWQMVRSRW
eukprot:1153840-Pelagomonas_calceolata.AAC.6